MIFAATDPTLPANVSAVAALIGIVWWLVRRADNADERRDTELAATRKELADLRAMHAEDVARIRAEVDIQRDEKHAHINRLSAAIGALSLAAQAADRCECDALEPVKALIGQVLDHHDQTKGIR